MGAFNTAVITDAGEVLLAKIIAGTETLNLTSAKTSDYEYPAETSFKALTDLQGIKQTMANPTAQVLSDTVIGVQALFGNQDVAQAYDIWNIGLYAMDGDNEILFSISSAQTPDQMPAFEGVAPSSYIYDIRLAVSQAADITIEVNPAGTVTQEQLATKVTANGGNIGDTVVNFDDSGSVPDITSFPAFLATLVSGSKIGTFFRNFLAGAQFLLHVGSIVNNCVTDNPELPLSAAQGKVLMDLYTVLNTKLSEMPLLKRDYLVYNGPVTEGEPISFNDYIYDPSQLWAISVVRAVGYLNYDIGRFYLNNNGNITFTPETTQPDFNLRISVLYTGEHIQLTENG